MMEVVMIATVVVLESCIPLFIESIKKSMNRQRRQSEN